MLDEVVDSVFSLRTIKGQLRPIAIMLQTLNWFQMYLQGIKSFSIQMAVMVGSKEKRNNGHDIKTP